MLSLICPIARTCTAALSSFGLSGQGKGRVEQGDRPETNGGLVITCRERAPGSMHSGKRFPISALQVQAAVCPRQNAIVLSQPSTVVSSSLVGWNAPSCSLLRNVASCTLQPSSASTAIESTALSLYLLVPAPRASRCVSTASQLRRQASYRPYHARPGWFHVATGLSTESQSALTQLQPLGTSPWLAASSPSSTQPRPPRACSSRL